MPPYRGNRPKHPLPSNPANHKFNSGSGNNRFNKPGHQPHNNQQQSNNERVQRIKPCRTLFVRNINYEANPESVRKPFESFGELSNFFDLIGRRGMCFVTYFDVRSSELAFNAMQDAQIDNRSVDVHYSLPKADETSQPCDRDKNQGTLSIWLQGSSSPINDTELYHIFSDFGEIKEVRNYEDRDDSRLVEYYDSRSANNAYDHLNGSTMQDGTLNLYFEWDCPMHAAPRKSGGFVNKILPPEELEAQRRQHEQEQENEQANAFLNTPARDFSNDDRRGGFSHDRRNNNNRPMRGKRGSGVNRSSNNSGRGGHNRNNSNRRGSHSYDDSSNDRNMRRAYGERNNNRIIQPPPQVPAFGTFSQQPPITIGSGYGMPSYNQPPQAPPATETDARLLEAQKVQALLSSLNPQTLGMASSTPAPPMPQPAPQPAPALQPIVLPQPQSVNSSQPLAPTPYYAPMTSSPPITNPTPAPSTLPPNIMSILQQAASSNANMNGYNNNPPNYQQSNNLTQTRDPRINQDHTRNQLNETQQNSNRINNNGDNNGDQPNVQALLSMLSNNN